VIDLIVSRGRVADKTDQTVIGAEYTAVALSERFGVEARPMGTRFPATEDDWTVSLPQAAENLTELAEAVRTSLESGNFPIIASNTCPASLATLPVVAQFEPGAVILWIDAHGDFNTPETTTSGYLGGMVLSAACGLWDSGHGAGLAPERTILLGARDIDELESELLKAAGVRVIPVADVTPETIKGLINDSPVWVHIDWDVLEPGYIPADYDVPNGVLPKQLRDLFSAIPLHQLIGIELAEFKAPQDGTACQQALAYILDIVEPVFLKAGAGDMFYSQYAFR
jgi:arginase family enzyme